MWWKTILQVAVAVGLDKWAKKKAKKLVEKLRAKFEKKIEKIESAVKEKVEKVIAEDGKGNKFVVTQEGGKTTVKRI